MLVRDVTLASPKENILFDDVLLDLAEKGQQGESLRFWESSVPFIVLGRICKEQEDVRLEVVRKDGVEVLRRSSGGGTVVQGPGCFNYTMIIAKDRDPQLNDISKSYVWIMAQVVHALGQCGVEVEFKPISDLADTATQKKISGNAQRRGRHFILHHGTILYNFNLALIPKYLQMPHQMPVYRQNRSHEEFVTNIAVAPAALKVALQSVFRALEGEPLLNFAEREHLNSLMASRVISVT